MRKHIVLFMCCAAFGAGAAALAQIPPTMSYQGVLMTETGHFVPDAEYQVTFRLYESADSPPIWAEMKTVTTHSGVFDTLLGATNPLDVLAFDVPYWLGIAIGDDAELTPRMPLASSAYAFTAATANTAALAQDLVPDAIGSVDGVVNDHGDVDLVAGKQITITPDDLNNTITIAWSGPDWSHEEAVAASDSETWSHNLGGDPAKYLVVMDGRESGQPYHQANFGTNPVRFVAGLPTQWIGAEWKSLTSSSITVTRGSLDDDSSVGHQWDYIRVRIWKNQ